MARQPSRGPCGAIMVAFTSIYFAMVGTSVTYRMKEATIAMMTASAIGGNRSAGDAGEPEERQPDDRDG